ncbi:MAG: hypothetical protein ABIE07_01530 [Candidatus Zixiibacteriota bacterium]
MSPKPKKNINYRISCDIIGLRSKWDKYDSHTLRKKSPMHNMGLVSFELEGFRDLILPTNCQLLG